MKSMKAFLAAGVAAAALCGANVQAADLAGKHPIYKAAPLATYNWTGWYGGVNVGVGASQIDFSIPPDGADNRNDTGLTAGVQGGFNWQFAPSWVAGIEGDIGYLGIKRSSPTLDIPGVVGSKTDWYGTLRGRFGYTSGPALFYATGGAAFVHVKNNVNIPNLELVSNSEVAAGWTAGGGMETLLGGNWSAKAEYLYVDAGNQDVNSTFDGLVRFDNRFHIYRYGVNYKFGAPAVSSPLPAHNWTGFYVGANIGPGLSHVSVHDQFGLIDLSDAGFTGGVQAGYNWQFTPALVVGLEGDVGVFKTNRAFTEVVPTAFGEKSDWYSTIRGRLGYSTGPALLYLTGGAAFVNVTNNVDSNAPSVLSSKSETATGWTVGTGIEAALTQNWTAKTEYLFIDAGSQDVTNTSVVNQPVHFDNRFHVFRFGLNYAFGH